MSYPNSVRVVEVGPRDGLQNEPDFVPLETKIAFVDALSLSGLRDIEVTSFVNPKVVPQLADAEDILTGIDIQPGVRYFALIPNLSGLERWLGCAGALPGSARAVALFTSASETFNRRNVNATISESLEQFRQIIERLTKEFGGDRPFVRGYVSTVVRCPYEGRVAPEAVARVVNALFELGVNEVSLGDTVGAATPSQVSILLGRLLSDASPDRLCVHFHDTRGTALANVLAAMEMGISNIDSSAGGLGGCPFAPGASGNLASEDLVYMLDGMAIETGVNLQGIVRASEIIDPAVQHALPSRELRAFRSAGF